MEFAFYSSALVALVASCLVITHRSPMRALLYLIVSLLAVAMLFFSLGANFAGAMQVVIYAGAILVLFVFVVMMLNLGDSQIQHQDWLRPRYWIGPGLLSLLLLSVLTLALHSLGPAAVGENEVSAKQVGISLFGPYVLVVELASLLLLAGMVTAFHLGHEHSSGESQAPTAEGDK